MQYKRVPTIWIKTVNDDHLGTHVYNEPLLWAHGQHACGCISPCEYHASSWFPHAPQTYSHHQGQICGTLTDNTEMSAAHVLKTWLSGYYALRWESLHLLVESKTRRRLFWQHNSLLRKHMHKTFIHSLWQVWEQLPTSGHLATSLPKCDGAVVATEQKDQHWYKAYCHWPATTPERGCWHISQWWSVDIQ